jgi:hypothetical protein
VLKIAEIKGNTSSAGSFVKRFFSWFNMFRIVKYLNHVHQCFYEKVPVQEAACELLSMAGQQIKSRELYDLLLYFRSAEKNH